MDANDNGTRKRARSHNERQQNKFRDDDNSNCWDKDSAIVTILCSFLLEIENMLCYVISFVWFFVKLIVFVIFNLTYVRE